MAAALNARFQRPARSLADGLLVHMFDSPRSWRCANRTRNHEGCESLAVQTGSLYLRWQPTPPAPKLDRFSASYLNAHMPANDDDTLALYEPENGGIILRTDAKVRCMWPFDAATGDRKGGCYDVYDSRKSASLAPVPFWPHGLVNGFDHFLANWSAGRATGSRPCDKKDAKKQQGCAHHFYTEVVVDGKAFVRQLPQSVEAFVYPLGSKRSRFGEAFVRESHAQFLHRFNRTSLQTPLLRLDFRARGSPLSTITSPPSPSSERYSVRGPWGRSQN